MSSSTETRDAWVVLGGIHLLNGISRRRANEPIVLVRVAPQEICVPSTTVVVKWDTLGTCQVAALTADGNPLGRGQIDGSNLFPDAIAGTALREMVGDCGAPGLVPLCYLAEYHGGYHVYAQIRFYTEDACFIRTSREPVGEGPVEELRWLEPALAAHAEEALRLNNHLRYYRTLFGGTELEYKYNLESTPNIWAASRELLNYLRLGQLADCRPEYRDEFQSNYLENHLFDVTGPDTELGYASFIRRADGGYALKRKWFSEDSFARRERIYPHVEVSPEEFEEYLRSQLGLQVRAMPPFRRVRYDVHCESMRTGHVYGIFFDHCSLLEAPEIVLSQCEMEYRRTRSLLDHDENDLLREMERIEHWLRSYLIERGWTRQRTFYSKRSFLRDAVAARPELTTNGLRRAR